MVRCGSCQEVFDATTHLTSGIPGESKPVRTPSPPPPSPSRVTPPAAKKSPAPVTKPETRLPPARHEKPDANRRTEVKVPAERKNMPDQTPFMESIYDERSAYNNLDDMGPIHIPGELNFGDSIIKFVNNDDTPAEEIQIEAPVSEPDFRLTISDTDYTDKGADSNDDDTHPQVSINNYEDTEDKETPATDSDRDGINNLYQIADDQIHDDEALAKNIEELLSFASELDSPRAKRQPVALDDDELDDFEKELDGLKLQRSPSSGRSGVTAKSPPPVTLTDKAKNELIEDFIDLDVNFDDDEPEPVSDENTEPEEAPAAAEVETEPETFDREEPSPSEPENTTGTISPVEEDLPSPDYEIPKALRANFEDMNAPLRPIGLTLAMGAAIVVLLIGFLFQLVFFRSYGLANSFPGLNPLLTSICNTIPCRYSGAIDVSKIELLNRDVRGHPTQKNALLISAAFINNAKFDQPFPTIAVKLSDLSGNVVATRHFKPEEYLGGLYSKFLLMESGTPVHITLAVLDPGDDAINFEFSFLQ